MARASRKPSRHRIKSQLPSPALPFDEDIPIDTGTVRLQQESDGAVLVLINGMPSSMLDPEPTALSFEYMRWMHRILVAVHASDAPLAIAHLGGGAAALPRALAYGFPRSTNTVVEIDGRLNTLVREWFSLPKAPRVSLRTADALTALSRWRTARFSAVIRDAFADGHTPAAFTTVETAQEVQRVLKPGGMYLANADMFPGSTAVADEVATLRELFAHVAVVAEPSALKKRRRANCVLIGTAEPLPPAVERTIRSDAVSVRLLSAIDVDRLARSGRVLRAEPAGLSERETPGPDEPAQRKDPAQSA